MTVIRSLSVSMPRVPARRRAPAQGSDWWRWRRSARLRRGRAEPEGAGCSVAIWINQTLGAVRERDVRRVFRNGIGERCVEVVVAGRIQIEVLDYRPSVALLRQLRNNGTDIAEDVVTHQLAPAHLTSRIISRKGTG
jgi:hypothetical protein